MAFYFLASKKTGLYKNYVYIHVLDDPPYAAPQFFGGSVKLDPRHSPKSDSAAPPKSSQLAVQRVAWVPVANFATRNPREGYLLFDPKEKAAFTNV